MPTAASTTPASPGTIEPMSAIVLGGVHDAGFAAHAAAQTPNTRTTVPTSAAATSTLRDIPQRESALIAAAAITQLANTHHVPGFSSMPPRRVCVCAPIPVLESTADATASGSATALLPAETAPDIVA